LQLMHENAPHHQIQQVPESRDPHQVKIIVA